MARLEKSNGSCHPLDPGADQGEMVTLLLASKPKVIVQENVRTRLVQGVLAICGAGLVCRVFSPCWVVSGPIVKSQIIPRSTKILT